MPVIYEPIQPNAGKWDNTNVTSIAGYINGVSVAGYIIGSLLVVGYTSSALFNAV